VVRRHRRKDGVTGHQTSRTGASPSLLEWSNRTHPRPAEELRGGQKVPRVG
jgi:hypothetical protein